MQKNPIERARAYLAKMAGAISGAGGHNATFHVACILIHGFRLSTGEALPLFLDWNSRCQPPWSDAELRHKLLDAERAPSSKPRGHFLKHADSFQGLRVSPHVSTRVAGIDEKCAKRKTWPPFENPSPEALTLLAKLRHVSFEGVSLMAARGLLRATRWYDSPAWIVTDCVRANAQARRMDGQPWPRIGAKAQTLPGSRAAWPLGAKELAPFPVVLLCEGGPDLLAAHHFLAAHNREADAAAAAVLGASNSIPADALPFFAGKRVRIFGHADKSGGKAVARWAEQLASVGASVDAAAFTGLLMADSTPVKDLNDCTRIHSDDTHELENLIPK